jgi:hypothetical protein
VRRRLRSSRAPATTLPRAARRPGVRVGFFFFVPYPQLLQHPACSPDDSVVARWSCCFMFSLSADCYKSGQAAKRAKRTPN